MDKQESTSGRIQDLLDFLSQLDRAGIHFRLNRVRDEAIMVEVTVPGERWEIEYFGDGHTEIERFGTTGNGVVSGSDAEQLIRELFERYSD